MRWVRTFPFSNFQPFEITHRGITYQNVETFYQAMKFTDPEVQQKIASMKPAKAKTFARTLEPRVDWDTIKDQVMEHGLQLKFAPGTYWSKRLLETPDSLLVETNYWHDNYWGTCHCEKCGNQGENRLGETLRLIKKDLLKKQAA
jgi:ribA/ribD-fused uncharacterized protein